MSFKTTGHIIDAMGRPNVRQPIIDAALRLFLERGFNASSVQDVTSAAGVPKGSFYNHFESKEQLGAEIVDLYGAPSERRKNLNDPALAPLERLRLHFDGIKEMLVGNEYSRGCLIGSFSAELPAQSPLIRNCLQDVMGRWTQELEVAILDGQADGSISSDMPANELAAFLFDAYEGAVLRARVERNHDAIDRFINVTFEKLLK